MKCRLCKNHGILTLLRGHKYKCPFRRCSCFNCKATQMRNADHNRLHKSRTHGYQHDENNDLESNESQKVVAWINGEEIQDDSVEAHASEQVQSEDEPLCASQFQQTVTATAVARTQILKQIKELHDLKECGALSTKEFEDAKAVVLKDFK